MKERPILFSAPMVLAILAGRKTQTRRAVKFNATGRLSHGGKNWHPSDINSVLACPYGQPVDQLWVREAFMREAHPSDFGITEKDIPHTWAQACAAAGSIYYRADPYSELLADGRPWKPSIHMRREYSRIQLEITAVRVERLQDISDQDAIAEGMPVDDAVYDYSKLWDQINGAGSWSANPLVWVVEFRVLKGGA